MIIVTGYHVFWRIWRLSERAKQKWNEPEYAFLRWKNIRIGNYYFDTKPFWKLRLQSASKTPPSEWLRQFERADPL